MAGDAADPTTPPVQHGFGLTDGRLADHRAFVVERDDGGRAERPLDGKFGDVEPSVESGVVVYRLDRHGKSTCLDPDAGCVVWCRAERQAVVRDGSAA